MSVGAPVEGVTNGKGSGAEAGGGSGAETRWRAGRKNTSLSEASSRRMPAWKTRDGVPRCVFEEA
jgi:hypothetical protein